MKKIVLSIFFLFFVLLWLCPSQPTSGTQEIQFEVKTIETRPGVALRFLLGTPPAIPKGVLIIFPGGNGANHWTETNGQVRLGNNFLVRSAPEFLKREFAVAIVDLPSDQAQGMSDQFRTSSAHTQDIQKIIDFLDSQGFKSIDLVGTSRGTISVAFLGTALKDDRLKGMVLTATMGSRFLSGIPLGTITLPTLIAHHRDDECNATPFREAMELVRKLSSSPKVNFVEVRGGLPPRSTDPCQALHYHGFYGVEEPVVQVLTDWLLGKEIPSVVGK
jgi:hypothetical protein